MPRLAGTFTTESNRDMGTGMTKKGAAQRLGWFAIYLDDDRVLVRALGADGLPTIVSKVEASKVFLSEYTPDYRHYLSTIQPLLQSLRERLGGANGDHAGLDGPEATVFKALVLDEDHLPDMSGEERRKLAADMLDNLPSFEDVASEHKHKINSESIASRKNGDYEGALSLYGAMLRANPDDDHIFFNVARVYFEKGDHLACRNYLRLALKHDPQLSEAEKFLKYLDSHAPLKKPDGRNYLRYGFQEPQPCLLGIEGREVEGLVMDVSEAGARIQLGREAGAQLGPGLELSIAGSGELLPSFLDWVRAQVVWAENDICGVAFHANLDMTTDEFKQVIAYTRLV